MKRLFILLLCLTILAGCGGVDEMTEGGASREIPNNYQMEKNVDVIQGNRQFAIDFMKQLNCTSGYGNMVFSPYSITEAVGMAYLGSQGETKAEFDYLLGLEDVGMETYKKGQKYIREKLVQQESITVDVNNSVWIRQGFEPKQTYVDDVVEVFDAYVNLLDFSKDSSVDKMNGWIEEKTDGMIDKVIEPPIDPLTQMFLINTVYFNGEWSKPFEKRATTDKVFWHADKEPSQVKAMRMREGLDYMESDNYQALHLPYKGRDTGMIFIKPDKDIDLNDFVEGFSLEKLDYIISELKYEDTMVQIPRFKMEFGTVQLVDDFKALGVTGPFYGQTADFRGIYEGEEALFISNILHKAVIEVDELGTEAAAATVVEMTKESAKEEIVEPKRFIADGPFMYIIYDWENDTILFLGKVMNL